MKPEGVPSIVDEVKAPAPICTATLSLEDNKLRLYATERLDAETYAAAKAAGFSWAPKQKLFVAPRWTPDREDLLETLVGVNGIDFEETPLAERAAERSERFEGYCAKRGAEADSARAHVERIAGSIPLGQPIMVGHHSERRARRDAGKIEAGMATAVRLHDTAAYWERRAERVTRHAAYKADPGLRARRIATLEAEERGHRRALDKATDGLNLWTKIAAVEDPERQRKQAITVANCASSVSCGLWHDLTENRVTAADACVRCIVSCQAQIDTAMRWVEHVTNRLAYERVLLGRAPDEKTKIDRTKRGAAALPLLNYRAPVIAGRNKYNRHGEPIQYTQVAMPAAEFAKIHTDYKGTCVSVDGTHRFRVAVMVAKHIAVFVTDSKVHPVPVPVPKAPEPTAEDVEAEIEAEEARADLSQEPVSEPVLDEPEPPLVSPFEAMRASLKAGVRAVSVPELFVSPTPLAERVVDETDIKAGDLVLEPEAGLAALAIAARNRGATVVCVDNAHAMVAACQRAGFVTHEGDFLDMTPETLGLFDRVVMNPPFSAEVAHVLHAWEFVKPGGRLVSVMSAGVRSNRKARAFRDFVDAHGTMEPLPAGSFTSSGTGVNTVLVVLDKPV